MSIPQNNILFIVHSHTMPVPGIGGFPARRSPIILLKDTVLLPPLLPSALSLGNCGEGEKLLGVFLSPGYIG